MSVRTRQAGRRAPRRNVSHVPQDRSTLLRKACEAALTSPGIGPWESLETRTLLAATPVVWYKFDVPPDAGDTVVNAGSGGAAYNGTLVASPDPDVPNGVDEDTPGEKPTRISEATDPTPETFVDDRLSFPGVIKAGVTAGVWQGSGGRVDSATPLQNILGRSATVTAWIKTTQVGESDFWRSPGITGVEQAGAGNDVFYGYLDPTGHIAVRAGDGGAATSTTAINDDVWHFVAASRNMNSGEVAIYVDGNLEDTALSETGVKSSKITSIGAITTVAGDTTTIQGYNHYNGQLDEVQIYDSVLTPTDVAQLYNSQSDTDVSATTVPLPTAVSAAATSPTNVAVTFTDAATNETAYELYRSRSSTPTGLTLVRTWQKDPADPTAAQSGGVITINAGGLTPATTYFFYVRGVNAGTPGPFASASATTQNPRTIEDAGLTLPDPGPGALVRYYNASSNQPLPDGDPVVVGVEPNISFANGDNWGNGSPAGVNADNFTGIWTGMITAPQTGTYRFDTNTDDGAFVYVNGVQVVNDPTYHGTFVRNGDQTINLTAGQAYPFYMKMFEGGGGAAAELRWLLPDGTEQVIPTGAFTSNRTFTGTVTPAPTGITASNIDVNQASINFANDTSYAGQYYFLVSPGATFDPNNVIAERAVGPEGGPTTFTGLSPNTQYSVQIRAFSDVAGLSDPGTGTFTTAAVPVVPAAPVITKVLPRAGQTPITFTDNSGNESGFVLERKTGAGAYAPVGTPAASAPGDSGGSFTFVDTTTVAGTTYTYRMRAIGQGTPPVESANSNEVTVTPLAIGDGLIAYNFETRFFDDNPNTDLDPVVDHDTNLDENWGSGGPAYLEADPSAADPDDTWSIVFDGQIRPEFSENYTFYTGSDDGIEMRIIDPATGQTILQGPPNGIQNLRGIAYPYQDQVGTVALQAGKKYDIRVIWTENGGGAAWRVAWSSPSVPFEVVPNAVLFEPDATVAPLAPANLTARPLAAGVHLAWDDRANNETGFIVERREGAGAYAQIGTVDANIRPNQVSSVPIRVTFDDTTGLVGHTYTYRVRATNGAGASPNSNEATAAPGGAGGTGLLAKVYDTRFFTDNPDDPADPHIDHDLNLDTNWGSGGPTYLVGDTQDPNLTGPNDTWSVVWTGQVQAEFSENYTFYTGSDDGIELTITDPATGKVILDGPPGGIQFLRGIAYPYQDTVGTVPLQAGKKYDIQVRFSENGGGAAYRVAWSSPSIPFEPIPDLQLFESTGTENVRPAQNLTANVMCTDRITLDWADASLAETGSVLQRATSATGPWTDVATLGPDQNTNVTDLGPTGGFAVDTDYFYRVVTNGPGGPVNSDVLTAHTYNGSTVTDTNMKLNGTATFITVPPTTDPDGQALRLTDNINSQSGTAFLTKARDVDHDWSTTFDFQIPETSGNRADGFTFMMQSNSPNVVGGGGGGLASSGIGNSLAIKFDIYNAINQTGIYLNGAMNDAGTDIGFNIANGHKFRVTLDVDSNYDDGAGNTTLDQINVKIEDLTDPTVTPFETLFNADQAGNPFDISQVLGPCGFIGFTGATGGENAEQQILDWSIDNDGAGTGAPQEIPLVAPVGGAGARVTKVFVNGTNLTANAAWRNAAGADATFGYPISDGANQLRPVPWTQGINKVSIQFDTDVSSVLDQGDLVVNGSGGPIGVTGFTYDAPTKTGTWTLASTVTLDKLRLVLDDAGFGTTHLDGEWVNPSTATPAGDTYPSGDGLAGGDFNFRINVLRGDANGDSVVNALDVADIKKRLTRRPGDGVTGPNAYSIFADLNADGVVNALDVAAVKARLGNRLTTLPDPATALLFA